MARSQAICTDFDRIKRATASPAAMRKMAWDCITTSATAR
jgi:hypothetical protein